MNHLDPNIKKGDWTEEEDRILLAARDKFGNAWSKIAKLLPGRSVGRLPLQWRLRVRSLLLDGPLSFSQGSLTD
jgi:hypothetical protein